MARMRYTKPQFMTSETIVTLSDMARAMFGWMWIYCDDAGVHPASCVTLKIEIFPASPVTVDQVQGWVKELLDKKLLVEFESGGKRFWHVRSWWEHQRVAKPFYSFPTPPGWVEVWNEAGKLLKLPATAEVPKAFGKVTRRSDTSPLPVTDQSGTSNGQVRLIENENREREDTKEPEAAPPESAQEPPAPEEFSLSGNLPQKPLSSARTEKPQRSEPPDPEATFDGFWKACSRKSGKAKARSAWTKARQSIAAEKGLSLDEAARWLTGRMEVFAATPAGQAGRYTPHPATWLNAARYDDDEATWQDEDRRETQKAVDPRGNMAAASRAIASIDSGNLRFPVGDRGPPRIARVGG